ncbi:MAG: oligosaccharide flippase family protein [Geminicoccaceae bacterium]|nr:oligosaccharide flippase family protein [Geminicoccaceae bacterium]MDW8370418.1 oligosaccharide flippase family protein [Geminicoccaceae bacterium]
MAAGAAWMVALRFASRFLGVASMLVLARLLTPEDFGLVALATTVAALIDIASEFNFDLALIRDRGAGRAEYDTAWTLIILKCAALAVVLAALAAPAAAFFDDARLEAIFWILAGCVLFEGFGNIGTVDFRRDLEIAKEFRFHLFGRLAQVGVAVSLAFWFRDWRALVAGIVARYVALFVASWTMSAYRPRLSLARWRELVHFSKWVLVNNGLGYLRERIDQLVVGKFLGPAPLGLYAMAQEIADLPTSELAQPVARAAYPGYARIAHEPARLAQGYLDSLAMLLAVTLPAAVGIALLADPLVRVLLGAKWLETVPLIGALVLYGVLRTASTLAGPLFLAMGRVRIEPALLALYLALLVPLLFVLVERLGLMGAVVALTICAAVNLVLTLLIVGRLLRLSLRRVAGAVWRTTVATAIMAMVVGWLERQLGDPVLELAAGVGCGALSYGAILFALWWAVGRPAGAERTLLAQLAALPVGGSVGRLLAVARR